MNNILLCGEKMLNKAYIYAAQIISYYRLDDHDGREIPVAENIQAKLGRPTSKTDEATVVNLQEQQKDFIVKAADLPPNFVPIIGDVIHFNGNRYQVSRPAKVPYSGMPAAAPCWDWHTRHSHTEMRIHAKHLGIIEEEEPDVESGDSDSPDVSGTEETIPGLSD